MHTRLLARLTRRFGCATRELIVIAPFIKANVLKDLFKEVKPTAEIVCVTRWRADEIAAGVSDLEVWDICANLPNARLLLLHHLHAKYYRFDDRCLIGSANLTSKALGRGEYPNLELLAEMPATSPELAGFEDAVMNQAVAASQWKRSLLAAAVRDAQLPSPDARSAYDSRWARESWLPRCTVPQQLYSIYKGDRSRISANAYRDGLVDIENLQLSGGLDATGFRAAVAERIVARDLVSELLLRLEPSPGPEVLEEQIARVAPVYLSSDDARVLASWLLVFFPSPEWFSKPTT